MWILCVRGRSFAGVTHSLPAPGAPRAAGARIREVRLVDARAIRAVAHIARQQVIDVLYTEQRPYTATQLAELTGLSPSAMSYHLRALEKWGVVERAEESDDARNRPWRACEALKIRCHQL